MRRYIEGGMGQLPSFVEKDRELQEEWLLYAAKNGHEAVVVLLLEQGAYIEAKNRWGRTPLLYAALKGHEAVVKLLLEQGAHIEEKDIFGRTPLSYAVKEEHEAVVKLLLDTGAYIEEKDRLTLVSDRDEGSSAVDSSYHSSSIWDSHKKHGYAESVQSTNFSVYSDLPRLTHPQIISAREVIAQMLADDEELLLLFQKGVDEEKIGGDRLERNFQRLLGMYSKELASLAPDKVCRDAAIFVGFHAKYISMTIRQKFGVPSDPVVVPRPTLGDLMSDEVVNPEKIVHEYLRGLQEPETELISQLDEANEFEFEAVDFGDEDDGKRLDRADEENMSNHLEQVKGFLRSQEPFNELKTRLRAFVIPEPEKQAENQASTEASSGDNSEGASDNQCKLTISMKGCH